MAPNTIAPLVIDTNSILTPYATNKLCDVAIAGYGSKVCVIRYFSRVPSYKVLTDDECVNIAQADAAMRNRGGYFLLGIVHEIGADPGAAAIGALDGAYCRTRLKEIGAPSNAWIAPAIDEDAPTAAMQNRLIDYTKAFFDELPGVTRAMYGPGVMLELALKVGTIDFSWVTESMGFTGSRAFLASGKCDLWQMAENNIAGLSTDTNMFNTKYTGDPTWTPEKVGFFVPDAAKGVA